MNKRASKKIVRGGSGQRCEVVGCRGNTPCPACLAVLSCAVVNALEDAFPDEKDQNTVHERKRQELTRKLRMLVLGLIQKRLSAAWARSIVGIANKKNGERV